MKFKTSQIRKEWINKKVQEGLSYADIAKLLGLSKQRVHQIFRNFRYVDVEKLDKSAIHKQSV